MVCYCVPRTYVSPLLYSRVLTVLLGLYSRGDEREWCHVAIIVAPQRHLFCWGCEKKKDVNT